MKKTILVLTISMLISANIIAQNFINGDLEGVITGFSNLPPSWELVSYDDVNCQATLEGATPDLINSTQPSVYAGIIGMPFSGNTFVGGSYGISAESGTTFHEGIQQSVSGFTIGQTYDIIFYQSVVKTIQSLDTSGLWMVVVDNSIIGVTEPSSSQNAFNSISVNWEYRKLSFTATENTHIIKFLPLDDDDDNLSSPTNINGALYMGIDSIGLEPNGNVGININNLQDKITFYPNPTRDILNYKTQDEFIGAELIIFNTTGIKLSQIKINTTKNQLDLSKYSNGVYYIVIKTDFSVTKKIVIKY